MCTVQSARQRRDYTSHVTDAISAIGYELLLRSRVMYKREDEQCLN